MSSKRLHTPGRLTGSRIGPYEITRLLGAGGMGEVYLARDGRLDRPVALKILHSEASSEDDRRRLRREARAASAISHPNVAHIYEIGEQDGVSYIAMEYVPGASLDTVIASRRLARPEIVDVAFQVASVLSEAHGKAVIHRDLKPANIMLTERGQVKVLDFGLAKLLPIHTGSDTVSKPDGVVGTVHYMSPEQALGQQLDDRSDIFSFGTVLYELVTGKLPFRGRTVTETLNKIINEDPVPIEEKSFGRSGPLSQIIQKCLEKNPSHRYLSAADLLADLQAVRDGSRPRHSANTAALRKIRRHGVSFALLILAAIAGAAVWAARAYLTGGEARSARSIAVLPFVNATGDPQMAYVTDGLAESLINSFSSFQDVRVVPRRTAFRFRDPAVSSKQLARDLNVDVVLTGRVEKREGALSISAELIDVRRDRQVWGDRYESREPSVVHVHEQIARKVGSRLNGGQDDVRAVVQRRLPTNPKAYELYLKARYLLAQRTNDSIQKAEGLFRASIEQDPAYALAWAGLADSYILIAARHLLPSQQARAKAHEAAKRALALDNRLAEVQTAVADLQFHDWQWEEAEQGYRKAIQMDPHYITAHHWYSFYLAYMGRSAEAIREIDVARSLDPASPHLLAAAAWVYLLADQPRVTIELCEEAIQLDPQSSSAWTTLSGAYMELKNYEGWARSAERYYTAVNRPREAAAIREGFAAGGFVEARRRFLGVLKTRAAAGEEVSSAAFFQAHLNLGQKDEAFRWLERMYEERSEVLLRIRADPIFDSIRNDARFVSVLRRMGLHTLRVSG